MVVLYPQMHAFCQPESREKKQVKWVEGEEGDFLRAVCTRFLSIWQDLSLFRFSLVLCRSRLSQDERAACPLEFVSCIPRTGFLLPPAQASWWRLMLLSPPLLRPICLSQSSPDCCLSSCLHAV